MYDRTGRARPLLAGRQSHSRLFHDLHHIRLDMRNQVCSNNPKALSHDSIGSRKAFIVFITTWLFTIRGRRRRCHPCCRRARESWFWGKGSFHTPSRHPCVSHRWSNCHRHRNRSPELLLHLLAAGRWSKSLCNSCQKLALLFSEGSKTPRTGWVRGMSPQDSPFRAGNDQCV